jgi:MtN3 and saliva related transmembrane protein
MQATFPPERKTFPTSSLWKERWVEALTHRRRPTGQTSLANRPLAYSVDLDRSQRSIDWVGFIPASEDADIRDFPKPTTRVEMIWYIAQMSRANFVEWIGWLSSALLLATLMRQVYTQWRSRSDAGVSRWLFVGQVTASLGFTIYSVLVHNRVYIASNIAILATAIAGELIYLRNRKSANPR